MFYAILILERESPCQIKTPLVDIKKSHREDPEMKSLRVFGNRRGLEVALFTVFLVWVATAIRLPYVPDWMVLIGLSILIGYITGVPSRILQNAADACDKPFQNPPPLGEDSPRSNRLVDWAIMTWITGFLLWLVTMSVTGNLGLLTANVGVYTLCMVAYVAALGLECPVASRLIVFFRETKKVNPEQDESMFVWVLPAGLIASAPLVFGHYLPWSWSSSLWCGALAGLTAVILYTTLAAISNRHLKRIIEVASIPCWLGALLLLILLAALDHFSPALPGAFMAGSLWQIDKLTDWEKFDMETGRGENYTAT